MFRSLALGLFVAVGLALGFTPVERVQAQNTTCSDRPPTDVSNACANTRFVHNASIGDCVVFTSIAKGCVPASGGGTVNFLRADGTFAPTASGGSAIVGMILPWAGQSVPPTYLLSYGQAVSRATYADLFSALTATQTISCTSGSANITVSSDNALRMSVGGAIEASACFIAGTTVLSKSGTTLTLSNNSGATTSATITLFPWGNGDGSTTFTLPNLMGRTMVGRDNMSGSAAGVLTSTYYGTNPDAMAASGGAQSTTLVGGNLPPYTPSGSVSVDASTAVWNTVASTNAIVNQGASAPFTYISQLFNGGTGGGGVSNFNSAAGLAGGAITAAFTGAAQGGTSVAFSRVAPAVTIDYIIKALPDSAVGDTITVGVTNVAGGSTTNILYNNAGKVGEYALATFSDMYAGTAANKIVTPSVVWPPEVTVTYGTTTTFDMSTFRDAVVTLTGDITTMTVSNVVVGKSGSITFIQDSGGNHTTVWDSKFKFAGGTTPTLSTAANAVDILNYQCRTSTFCFAAMMNDVK